MSLVQPFPIPRADGLLAQAFIDQAAVQSLRERLGGKDDAKVREELDAYGDLDLLPQPWRPESCPARMRAELWVWLDAVVAWLNHEYGWNVERCIPSCWPRHPHLIHELAVLAVLRREADQTQTPRAMEDWHRYSLPMFIDRMRAQLGNGCPPGRHTPWPGAARYDQYVSADEAEVRATIFTSDTTRGARPPARSRRYLEQGELGQRTHYLAFASCKDPLWATTPSH